MVLGINELLNYRNLLLLYICKSCILANISAGKLVYDQFTVGWSVIQKHANTSKMENLQTKQHRKIKQYEVLSLKKIEYAVA